MTKWSDAELSLAIDQAYTNCPKYIQRRTVEIVANGDGQRPHAIESGDALTAELRAWIERADTFFVATAHPDGPTDVSHRGGAPGFVRLRGDTLRIPDYPGNSMFNTLGNLQLNPRAGLAFVGFAANRQLMLTGRVSLDLNGGETDGTTRGTGRWWTFAPVKWIVAPLHPALRWGVNEPSPFNP